jgi:tetratricopeptide (TPR) repeat protein
LGNYILSEQKNFRNHRGLIIGLGISTFCFILARAWMVLIYPYPEFRSDAVGYFEIVRDIMASSWPSFRVRSPGFPLFEGVVFMFCKSFYAIVLAQIFAFWCGSSFLIYAISRWKDTYAIPAALSMSAFYFVNATVIQDTMLYSDSFYTSVLLVTMGMFIIFLHKPNNVRAMGLSFAVGYLLWIKFAAAFTMVLLLIVAAHGILKKWPKKRMVLLFVPMGTMMLTLLIYNGFRDGRFELNPYGGFIKAGPGIADWQTDPGFSERVNNGILKSQEQFNKNDLEVIRTSWDVPSVWQAYQNNWGRCRYGSLDFNDFLADQNDFKKLATDSISRNPKAYFKFVYTMANMHFLFYPKVDNQNFQIYHLYREATALEAAHNDKDEYSRYYKPLYQPFSLRDFEGSSWLKSFHPYDRYIQAYTLLKPWIRHAFWPWMWMGTLVFCLWRCWSTRLKEELVVLCAVLMLAPLGAGLLTASVEVAILRYSYPLEFLSYLSPLVLWLALPESWKNQTYVKWFFDCFRQKKSKLWAYGMSAIILYSVLFFAAKSSIASYGVPEDYPLVELARRATVPSPESLYQLASQLRSLKSYEHALDACHTLLQLIPGHIPALFEQSLCLEAKGDTQGARQSTERLLQAPVRSELDAFFVGQAFLRAQKINEAIQFYRQIRQKNPSFHPGKFQNLSPTQNAEWDRLLK